MSECPGCNAAVKGQGFGSRPRHGFYAEKVTQNSLSHFERF